MRIPVHRNNNPIQSHRSRYHAAADLAGNQDVKEFYLGLSTSGRKSFRDAEHYRRRKRWLA